MFFEIFFEYFSDLVSSESRHEYETKLRRLYEREEKERTPSIALKEMGVINIPLGDMSPFGDIKIRKGRHYAFSMKASEKLYLTVRTDDEVIV